MIKYQLINDDINSFDAWCISSGSIRAELQKCTIWTKMLLKLCAN